MPESSIVVQPEPKGAELHRDSRLQAAGLRRRCRSSRGGIAVPIPKPPQPIVIADYGASTGHNSLLPIGAAIAVLRKRTRNEHSCSSCIPTLPTMISPRLFRTLEEDPDTYLRKDRATFASAVGRSFYSQILPSNSVNLGWSSWAIQWLSRVPAVIDDHLQVAYCADDSVRAAYVKQAAHDWHEFIAFRGRELCPGGRLVVTTMAIGDDGEFGYRPLLSAMMDALAELAVDGLITADEVSRMCVPTVGRRAADFRAPFAPSGRFERLEIEHLEVFDAADRFWDRYRIDSDATAFGARWAGFARASVFPTLSTALAGGAADPRATELCDRLEAGIAERLRAAPEQMQIPLAHVVLMKRPTT